jgi:hypothetical protein
MRFDWKFCTRDKGFSVRPLCWESNGASKASETIAACIKSGDIIIASTSPVPTRALELQLELELELQLELELELELADVLLKLWNTVLFSSSIVWMLELCPILVVELQLSVVEVVLKFFRVRF